MKKIAISLICLMVFPYAYASKARLESLGQDGSRGSFYIEDYRSVFYNPAYLNLKKNAVITEWGKSSSEQDSAQEPHAEGGIFGDYGSFTFGAYFGNELDANNRYRNEKFMAQDNRLDFLFAGDAGILWGIRAYYADNVDETSGVKKTNSAYGMSIGIISGSLESFVDVGLSDTSEGADASGDKWEADLALRAGAVYRLNSFAFLLEASNAAFDQKIGSASNDGKVRYYRVAAARDYSVNKTARVFSDIAFLYTDNAFSGSAFDDVKGYRVPVNLAFEADLNEWLQGRGSITHVLIAREEINQKMTSALNSTAVNAGLRYRAGKFNVDGIVGATSSGDKKGTFGTLSRVAVEYLF